MIDMNNISTIIELDADHQIWNNEMNDMKYEISEMEAILGNVRNTDKTIKKEHFLNQFSNNRNEIESIENRIQECQLHSDIVGGSCFELVTDQKHNYHQRIGQIVDRRLELFKRLKEEFQQFNTKSEM